MEVMDAIYRRRSVRKFADRAVSREDLRQIIAAGMMAPSAGNQQPWHFITVTDPTMLKRVVDVNPNARMAIGAPAGILVCGDTELEMHDGYWIQDCSAAVQNMLLAVHAMGLGAVWTGTWPRPERVAGFRDLFDLPDTVNPLAFIVLGYPKEGTKPQDPPDRFREDRIHEERWSKT